MKRLMILLAMAAMTSTMVAQGAPTINEIRIDQPSTDVDEYFELAGMANTSLDSLTYLVIGDGASALASGVIEHVTDLTGWAIPSDGYFLAVEDTFTLAGTPDLTTTLNFQNSDNVTHMLVRDFTGAVDDDLDIDNDGAFDVTPWSAVVDSVALVENADSPPTGTEWYYGPVIVGPDGPYVPGHVYRWPNGTGSWQIGQFDPVGGLDTPGSANVPEPLAISLLALGGMALLRRRR